MRTKTLFLAAAALAAGIASSMAQGSNVYSVNIVGWINVTNPVGAFTMLCNPLDNGTNDLYSLLPTAPNNSVVTTLVGSVLSSSTKSKGLWSPTDFIIPAGKGFFLKTPNGGTNTFIGSAPTSNNTALAAGTTVFIGSSIPFSGVLTDAGSNSLNLNSLPNNTQISVLQGGVITSTTKSKGVWTPSNFAIGVAQGFYVKPGAATTWIQWMQ